MLVHPLDGQQLVAVPAAAPLRPSPIIYISTKELVFNEQSLASLDAGVLSADVVQQHVVVPLHERLDEETEKMIAVLGEAERQRVVTLVVDGGVSFGSAVDTLYTAGRLGYQHFDFVVEPICPLRRTIRFDPPAFSAFEAEPPLAKLARERTAAEPRMKRAVVSAENHIPMEVLLVTFATLLGPDCKQHEPAAGCLEAQAAVISGTGRTDHADVLALCIGGREAGVRSDVDGNTLTAARMQDDLAGGKLDILPDTRHIGNDVAVHSNSKRNRCRANQRLLGLAR